MGGQSAALPGLLSMLESCHVCFCDTLCNTTGYLRLYAVYVCVESHPRVICFISYITKSCVVQLRLTSTQRTILTTHVCNYIVILCMLISREYWKRIGGGFEVCIDVESGELVVQVDKRKCFPRGRNVSWRSGFVDHSSEGVWFLLVRIRTVAV